MPGLIDTLLSLLFSLGLLLTFGVFALYAERKVAGFIQDRLGPMEVGKYGLAQSIADILKLLQKEDIVPAQSDKVMFKMASIIVFLSVFIAFAVIPFSPAINAVSMETGLFFVIAILTLDVIGILMAGWGSNSKFALLGSMRSVAQVVSYEIPAGISVLCVAAATSSLNLTEITLQQGVSDSSTYLFGLGFTGIEVNTWGGIFTWNIVKMPVLFIAFVIYFISSLAECNRAPFDIPEAESELVGGFHTEYSGFRFAIFFLAEYGMMLLVSLFSVVLFLGGWNTPLPNIGNVQLATYTSGNAGTITATIWAVFWLLSKSLLLVFLQIVIRWTYPRLRVDQLMHLSWKVLTPLSILTLLAVAAWRLLLV